MTTKYFVMMLILLSQLCACSYRVTGVMTSYINDHKPIEMFKQDDYDCTIMAKTLDAAQRASINSNQPPETLIILDIWNLAFNKMPNAIDFERFKCLQARGWIPRIQFVNTNYSKSSDDFFSEFNYCKAKLSDDVLLNSVVNNMDYLEKFLEDDESIEIEKREKMDNFAACLMQNGWILITQEPWYVNGQQLDYKIPFIPKGRWQPISEDEKMIHCYDPNKIIKDQYKIRFTILSVPKDISDRRIGLLFSEIDCKERMFRESQNRSLKDKVWQHIPPKSHGEVYYQKLCK